MHNIKRKEICTLYIYFSFSICSNITGLYSCRYWQRQKQSPDYGCGSTI